MKYHIDMNQRNGLMKIVMMGKLSVSRTLELVLDLVGHPHWSPGMNLLLDNRFLDLSEASKDQLRHLAHCLHAYRSQLGGGRCGILVNRGLDYGVTNIWKAYAELTIALRIRIFYEEACAIGWVLTGA